MINIKKIIMIGAVFCVSCSMSVFAKQAAIGYVGLNANADTLAAQAAELNSEFDKKLSALEERVSILKKSIEKINDVKNKLGDLKYDVKIYIEKTGSLNDELKATRVQLNGIKGDYQRLSNSSELEITQLKASIEQLQIELENIESISVYNDEKIKDLTDDLAASNELIANSSTIIETNQSSNNEKITNIFLVIGGLFGLLLLLVSWLIYRLFKSERNVLDELGQAHKLHQEEYTALDLKLSDILESQINSVPTADQGSDEQVEPDHSIPLKVATEIHRMRKRIDKMPDTTKGIKPLSKAVDRIEESLSEKGYEMIDLLGQQYVEGMTINHEYVFDEELSPGEKIISKVVKPQINYNKAIIQIADVIVKIGE